MKASNRRIAIRVAAALIVLLLGVLPPLRACFGPEYESVHFNDWRVDFLQMPRPWWQAPFEARALPPWKSLARSTAPGVFGADRIYEADNYPTWGDDSKRDALPRQALSAEKRRQFARAAELWDRYRLTLANPDFTAFGSVTDQPGPRGLVDRILALRLWRSASDSGPLLTYLQARSLVNTAHYTEARRVLARLSATRFAALADYLAAAASYYTVPSRQAAPAVFAALLRRRPAFPLALYMLGRSRLAPYYRAAAPLPGSAEENRRRAALRSAAAAYEACYRADPQGLLAQDALGMEGGAYFRLDDMSRALELYCRQLAPLPPGHQNGRAFVSARLCLQRMDAGDHQRLRKALLKEPDVACVYLDLLLQYQSISASATHDLGLFALQVLALRPSTPQPERLLTRLAIVENQTRHPAHAEKLLRRALRRKPSGTAADEAHWQLAVALRALHRDREALAEYRRVAATAITGRMRRGAHEAAAVTAEALSDYPEAIRHYFALEYRLDYGYVIDCLASADDLRAFLQRFPNHPRARLVRYSLGFRQLRAGRYDEAIRTLSSLGPWLEVAERKYPAAASKGKPRVPPLRLAIALRDAAVAARRARTDGERARIEYGAAQLIFRQRNLAFYNGALWGGERVWGLGLRQPVNLQRPDQPLAAEEQRKLDRYQWEHAALAQALDRFQHVANQYPHTPEAPKALYSAALCYTMLPHLERYWAGPASDGYLQKSVALYDRLRREYPHDPLAAAAVQQGGLAPLAKGAGHR